MPIFIKVIFALITAGYVVVSALVINELRDELNLTTSLYRELAKSEKGHASTQQQIPSLQDQVQRSEQREAALQQEREKAEALARDLETARAEVAALKPQAAAQQSLTQERKKEDPKAPLETQQEGAAHSAQISPSSVSSAVALEPEATGA